MKETEKYGLPLIELDDYYDVEVWNESNKKIEAELDRVDTSLEYITVNVKKFGAKGDGITDDTKAIKDTINYCSQNGFNMSFGSGEFLVRETLFINVEKLSISGISSETKIIINDEFVGDTLLYFYAENGEWVDREHRFRTYKDFKLENKGTKIVNGMRTSGETGTDKEGHVERVTFKNIMIKGFNVAILYSSHSYGFIFEKMYTPFCNYAIKSDTTQYDSGEISVFRNCFFMDSGHKIDTSFDLMFLNCTLHSMGGDNTDESGITIRNGAHLTFNQCHFERIQRTALGTTYLGPVFKLVSEVCTLTIQSSKFIVSGGNTVQFRSCMFDNSYGGTINFFYNDTQWYFKRVDFDTVTLKANNKLGCIFRTDGYGVVNFRGYNPSLKWDGGKVPLLIDNNSALYDYTFSSLTSKCNFFTLVNDDGTITGGAIPNITLTPTIVNQEGCINNTVCKINVANKYYNGQGLYVGVMMDIPKGTNLLTYLNRFWVSNFTGSLFRALSYKFYDEFGNLIPEAIIQKYNDNLTFSTTIENGTIYERNDCIQARKIPPFAKKVFVGLHVVIGGNSNGDIFYDYLIPSFI